MDRDLAMHLHWELMFQGEGPASAGPQSQNEPLELRENTEDSMAGVG